MAAGQRSKHQGVGSRVSGKRNSRLRRTCHAGLHQSLRRPLQVMRRGILLSTRRSATCTSDSATSPDSSRRVSGGAPGVQHAFRRFAPTNRVDRALSRRPDPRAVGRLFLTDRFRQLIVRRCVLVMVDRCAIRGEVRSTSGFALPVMVRPCERRTSDPALGFFLLQGCGRVPCTRIPAVVLTTGDHQPLDFDS
jgi:hypothetical protein